MAPYPRLRRMSINGVPTLPWSTLRNTFLEANTPFIRGETISYDIKSTVGSRSTLLMLMLIIFSALKINLA